MTDDGEMVAKAKDLKSFESAEEELGKMERWYNKGINEMKESDKLAENIEAEKGIAHCSKCGEPLRGDEGSICGNCAG